MGRASRVEKSGLGPEPGPPLAGVRRRLHSEAQKKSAYYETRKAPLTKKREGWETVSLRFLHTITSAPQCQRVMVQTKSGAHVYHYEPVEGTGGSQTYGPGSVKVRPAIARTLREMERNALATLQAESTERAVIIGPQVRGINRLMDVPPELFGQYMGVAPTFGVFR